MLSFNFFCILCIFNSCSNCIVSVSIGLINEDDDSDDDDNVIHRMIVIVQSYMRELTLGVMDERRPAPGGRQLVG